jgi:hypothetical protein
MISCYTCLAQQTLVDPTSRQSLVLLTKKLLTVYTRSSNINTQAFETNHV